MVPAVRNRVMPRMRLSRNRHSTGAAPQLSLSRDGTDSGLTPTSRNCRSSPEESDLISLLSFAFSYLRSAPFGLSRACLYRGKVRSDEKVFGADQNVGQLGG